MKTKHDPLSAALEELRHRPIVAESRDFARRWQQANARMARFRGFVVGPFVTVASACLVACVVFEILPSSVNVEPAHVLRNLFSADIIETPIAERRTVLLEDGSRVMLDAKSRVRVAFDAAFRDLELLEGQAHFEVAHDSRRPFRVRTQSAEVVAVGTKFDVAALSALTTVTLIEGRVNVRAIPGKSVEEPRVEALDPGQQLGITSDGQLLGKKTVTIATVTAWQRGTIVLDGVPLSEALAVLNRYSTTQIVIPDTQLHSRSISGVFRTGDVETEALVLQRYFGLQERSRSKREIVLTQD